MRIAIIGAGFTGLSAGYFLAKKGVKVTIFEKDAVPGGLASGFTQNGWNWPLEKHYHHIFKSDTDILNLAKEISVPIRFYKSKTSLFTPAGIFPFDSALGLLTLPNIDLISKLRTGATLVYLKLNPFWKLLENTTAKDFILKYMGQKSWQLLWKPLFVGKFGEFADQIPASWFWARIIKRGVYLGYPEEGFMALANGLAKKIVQLGGEIKYKTTDIPSLKNFDKVISTVPEPKLKNLGAITLVLRLNKPFLPNNIYWLNIGSTDFAFLSVVEHTNLIPRNNYRNEHLVYIGKYLPQNHKYFSFSKTELLEEYDKHLNLIHPGYKTSLIGLDIFKALYAQPVIPLNYSRNITPIKTHIKGLYSASIEQVYPYDRGVNYAIQLGERVAKIINSNEENI